MTRTARTRPSFLASTATLAGGQLAAQAVLVLLTPVITRLYSTEAYGAFSVTVALAVTLMPASCLRLNVAVLLPKSRAESNALAAAGALACLSLALLLLAALWLFHEPLAARLNLQTAPAVLLLLPLLLAAGGAKLLTDALAMRREHFGPISRAAVGGAIADRVLSIGLPLLGSAHAALLVVGRIGNFVVQSLWLIASVRHHGLDPADRFSRRDVAAAFSRYRHFAQFAFAVVLQQLSRQLPIVFIGIFYSATATGLFALIQRVLMEPLQLVGAAIGRGFAQRIAVESHSGGDIGRLALKLLNYMLALLVVPLAVLALIGPALFALVFGENWADAGIYLRYMAAVFFFGFTERSVVALFDVYHQQRQQSAFAGGVLIATVTSFSLAAAGLSLETVLLVYAVAFSSSSALRIGWILHHAGVGRTAALRQLSQGLATSALSLAPACAIYLLQPWQALTLVTGGSLYIAAYLWLRFARDRYVRTLLQEWRSVRRD